MNISATTFTNQSYLTTELQGQQKISTQPQENNEDNVTISDAANELKKYAVYPGWMGAYLPQVNVLNNSDSHTLGYPQWADDFRANFQSELGEYNSKLKDIVADSKQQMGISSQQDFYQSVLNNPMGSEQFKNLFEQKILNDVRARELMHILNISG